MMMKLVGVSVVGLAMAALVAGVGLFMTASPANAVVYCRAVGIPHGCVARPTAGAVVAHPVAPAGAVVAHPVAHGPVVYCRRIGVPKGCVMR
jgi:hypothetical protein